MRFSWLQASELTAANGKLRELVMDREAQGATVQGSQRLNWTEQSQGIRLPYDLWFSRSVRSDSLWPHGLQRTRLPCPSPSPRACSNSCPLSQWCHPTISSSIVPFSSIESVMSSNHFILYCPLLLLPSIFPRTRVFSNESALCIRWPNYWSFSISPSKKYSGLISFRVDWFDLLAVKRTVKRLPQHHSSKASILWCSAFFIIQLWHPYLTTGKTVTLTRRTFVGKVMLLLFNMLSRFVIHDYLESYWSNDDLTTYVFKKKQSSSGDPKALQLKWYISLDL